MHHKLLTLLFCVVIGIVAVHGQPSRLRFMNARFYSGQLVDITTDLYSTNTSMQVQGRFAVDFPTFPVSNYIQLPTDSMPLYSPLTFYAFDKDNLFLPVTPWANTSATLVSGQSYSLVYVDRTEDFGEPITDVPPQLFLFDEVGPYYGYPSLKIVNVAVSTYPYGYLWISTDRVGDYYVSYGSDTGFLGVGAGNLTITAHFPGFEKNFTIEVTHLNTVVYIRGDSGDSASFGYDVTTNDWQGSDPTPVPPVEAPYYYSTPTATAPGPSTPPAMIRFINTFDPYTYYKLTIYDHYAIPTPVAAPVDTPIVPPVEPPVYAPADESVAPINQPVSEQADAPISTPTDAPYYDTTPTAAPTASYTPYNITTYFVSDYKSFYSAPKTFYMVLRDQWDNYIYDASFYVQAGVNYTVYFDYYNGLRMLRDTPQYYNQTSSYLRIVNHLPNQSFLEFYNDSGYNAWYSNYGDIWSEYFQETSRGYAELYVSGNQTGAYGFYMNTGAATTVYLYSYQGGVYFFIDERPLPTPTGPICVNGYVESNGACNCYSGYTTDNSSPYKCTVSAPHYCFQNQTDALSNDFVPYIPYWNTQVYGNRLYFSINSAIVNGRRTLIELPNSQCSFINSPQYYQKYNNGGCEDIIYVNVPFIECGFVKTSSSSEDVYKGTVHVKQIDRVTVAGTTYDRVIDTPMPISIRLPKTLAVQSYLQVFGPPSLAIDAAFVGQTVNTESQSGNLQYVSAVQYPLQIAAVELVDLPYGVNAWIEVVNVNCSGVGPCVQRLELHLNTTSCSISGVYRMVVSLNCRSDQGCPDEAKNGTQVYIESRIVSQSLCGEVSVDIDLNGNIQAFTDQSFSNYALAFYPGQSAYFLISAYSSRVSLSRVSVQSVYYYGPNINYQYLSYNTSLSNIAITNNFTTGSVGNNQAWFGIDVSVSTPDSGNNSTLFKLYQGQNGVYNFVAIVDVEWFIENTPSTAPTAFKKRMALQGSVSNQGSQFTAQVQVAGPTPSSQQPQQQQQTPVAANPGTTGNDPVSSSVALSSSVLVMVVMAFIALF